MQKSICLKVVFKYNLEFNKECSYHMPEYQVLARKYRPQTFADVLGQDAIVTTIKNAIKNNRLAHGYLFCGSRGTGKTTLARIFAKALNCKEKTADFEPCNTCASCLEITSGYSLDCMEIDGASHRGIDDIRQINENVGYTPSSGQYKIYIIDEVHMLTKEAFNALLKTLEEPPGNVKFFFATTEPHKIPATILSRCQRFNLNRIPLEAITTKLRSMATDLNVLIDDDAIRLIATRADGGLRDAESLLDQIVAFNEDKIDINTIADVLGVVAKDQFFLLDQAGKEGNIAFAFELAHEIFSTGKDILHFVENLNEHIRNILLVKLSGPQSTFLNVSESEKERYETSSKIYTNEQCVTILEFLIEAQNQIRYMASPKIALEALLIRIIRTHQRIPIDFLVRRLAELEEKLNSPLEAQQSVPQAISHSIPQPLLQPALQPILQPILQPVPQTIPQPVPQPIPQPTPQPTPQPVPPAPQPTLVLPAVQSPKVNIKETSSFTEDPTPTAADLGLRQKKVAPAKETTQTTKTQEIKQTEVNKAILPSSPPSINSKYDTIFQFAAVELEGIIQKKR